MRNMMTGMSRGRKLLFIAPMAMVGMALFVVVGTLLVRALWNWLMPPLFGWPALGFWQALGMLALCRILVGGFGFRGSPGPFARRRIIERWEAMTPEERERFRQGMGARWGARRPDGGGGGEGTGETL
jgi:hypothetical protein